jgi:hypothetical protein
MKKLLSRVTGFISFDFAIKYPIKIIREKLNNRNPETTQLLFFLPEREREN